MEDFVVAEHGRVRVGPAATVGQRPGQVEQATGEQQYRRYDAGMIHTHGSARPPAQPSPENVAPTSSSGAFIHVRWIAAAAKVRVHSTIRQTSPNTCRQDEGGSGRAGDEEEGHRVVQALHALPPGSGPGTAMIERADPEQRAHASRVHGDRRDLRGSVRTRPAAAGRPPATPRTRAGASSHEAPAWCSRHRAGRRTANPQPGKSLPTSCCPSLGHRAVRHRPPGHEETPDPAPLPAYPRTQLPRSSPAR